MFFNHAISQLFETRFKNIILFFSSRKKVNKKVFFDNFLSTSHTAWHILKALANFMKLIYKISSATRCRNVLIILIKSKTLRG